MSKKMSRKTRALMWAILLISLIQMPHLAIMPGIDLIATKIFPERAFQTVQTVMSLPSILSVVAGIASATLVSYGFVSKKGVVVTGLSLVALTGVTALLAHTHFWHLCLINILLGTGMGVFIPNSQSIMFDSFDEDTRQFITGIQLSFINAGGIIMSMLGGLLTTLVWYGGHLIMLIATPVAIIAYIAVPKSGRLKTGAKSGGRSKLPADVYYYTALIFIFMIVYNVAAMNLSTHLAAGAIGNSATAGVATAVMMAGGVACGLVFPKISPLLRDNLISAAFVLMFVGYILLSLFPSSLAVIFAAMFICGTSISLIIPRSLFQVSKLTDPTNSALATMLVACAAPGTGNFMSPVIITNITIALAGDSTAFRYQFTGIVCLVIAVLIFLNNTLRDRRAARKYGAAS